MDLVAKSFIKVIYTRMSKWDVEQVSEWVEQVSEWVEQVIGVSEGWWVGERVSVWLSEWMNEWVR